jgi:hypothetical protein
LLLAQSNFFKKNAHGLGDEHVREQRFHVPLKRLALEPGTQSLATTNIANIDQPSYKGTPKK